MQAALTNAVQEYHYADGAKTALLQRYRRRRRGNSGIAFERQRHNNCAATARRWRGGATARGGIGGWLSMPASTRRQRDGGMVCDGVETVTATASRRSGDGGARRHVIFGAAVGW